MKNWKKIAYALARRLDQIMTIGGANLADSPTWCHNCDKLVRAAGIKPGSSKRYSPQKDNPPI